MINHNQDGAVNGVVISLVLTALLLVGAIGFGAWAFTSREDYKNHVDSKVSSAVETAKEQESARKDKQFAEDIKQPLKTYRGPEAFGSLVINFPKTWSGYVDDTGNSGAAVNGFFAPGTVPSITANTSVFALHVQVLNQSYAQVLQSFSSQVQTGKVTVSAYALPKLPKVVGVKLVGTFADKNYANVVLLPLRSQTIQIATVGTQYLNDFNTSILPNFSFSP